MGEERERSYVCIDLKSFYASVECRERGLDCLSTHLVVADPGRTQKTICLAVSPSLKSYGIPGRPRLFEVVERVREVNVQRRIRNGGRDFRGESDQDPELREDPGLALSYIVAPPRMALYMKYSTDIYQIYLRYVAPEDIHVYSIDEVFIDVTSYLAARGLTAEEMAEEMMGAVLRETGITATAGVAPNLYLGKVAMDIMAKHIPVNKDGARIASLDVDSYRRYLWSHRPITDFWRVGSGYARRLERHGIYTMGDVARCSLTNQDLLYQLFGVHAELLIDHAWGYEPSRMEDIRAYRPANRSICSGQVLQEPYDVSKGRLIVREMADLLALDLVEKSLVTDQVVLTVGYDVTNLTDPARASPCRGEVTMDRYGRRLPKHAHGSEGLGDWTSSARRITDAFLKIYDRTVNPALLIRRFQLTVNHVMRESDRPVRRDCGQLSLFVDYRAEEEARRREEEALEKERRAQKAVVELRQRFGKNAVLRGMNLQEAGTTMERNRQVGGHRAR